MPRALSVLIVITLLAQTIKSQAAPAALNCQISFSYWNDNFTFQKQLRNIITPGDDDFMTASFRLEVAQGSPLDWRGLEMYYAIFTNRAQKHRFDMLAGRWFRDVQHHKWNTKYAVGGLIRGNMGGDKIQNFYHSIRGYSGVELPYLQDVRMGLLLYGRVARVLKQFRNSNLQAYNTTALRLGAGPTNFRLGMEFETHNRSQWMPLEWTLTARLGYAYYLTSRTVIQPQFDQGVVTGIFYGMKLDDKLGLSFWFTENQYGLDDPYYGMTVTYRAHDLNLPKLHSVIFP